MPALLARVAAGTIEGTPMSIRIPDEVVFQNLAGEAVLLHLGTGIYFGLDAVGTRVWELIASHGRRDAIVDALLAEYDVEPSRLRADLDRLLARLAEKGLVTLDADEAAPAR